MENKTKKRSVGAMITGTILSGALFTVGSVNAAEMFSYDDLGNGAQLRSELLDNSVEGVKSFEAKCGEEKAADSKSAEHKCGEGKCGEGKSGEHKCGEDHNHKSMEKSSSGAKMKATMTPEKSGAQKSSSSSQSIKK